MNTFGKIFIIISAVVIVLLFVLLVILREIPSEAAVGFLGILVGSIIAGTVQFVVTGTNIKQQFRIAALDKRLQAHQDAYALWRRLLIVDRQTEEVFRLLKECKEWWNNNCLYLSADAREAFRKSYIALEYLLQPPSIQAGREATKKDKEDLENAGEIIVSGVYLPSIGETEKK